MLDSRLWACVCVCVCPRMSDFRVIEPDQTGIEGNVSIISCAYYVYSGYEFGVKGAGIRLPCDTIQILNK